ncbi:unnamed protein product [Clonostachys rosea f. rosea IK726]|uniref:Uncharacterized protein n=1 Tax=Clonostachys rosea f. rosea IK726 TaxID=1349383 RepID=A0ACA9UGM1_BIOOC|nr:unnamed protein product [Clonostachys rosea f. rosea IK726]
MFINELGFPGASIVATLRRYDRGDNVRLKPQAMAWERTGNTEADGCGYVVTLVRLQELNDMVGNSISTSPIVGSDIRNMEVFEINHIPNS